MARWEMEGVELEWGLEMMVGMRVGPSFPNPHITVMV